MSLFCEYDALKNESDVEQKFIYPFLTATSPRGLSLKDTEVYTKETLRQRQIGKEKNRKYYVPDYLVMIRGIPVLVVEAKKPNEDLAIAFSEARLYATEVNAQFPHRINACQYIIACNGSETWAGYADQDNPAHKLTFQDFNVENSNFVKLLEFCNAEVLTKLANSPFIKMRGKAKFYTPVSQIGGPRAQDEEVVANSYGQTLILENRRLFDPETEDDRIRIVENAYIASSKREQHMEPMYKEIRKFELPGLHNSTYIDSKEPTELAKKLSQAVDVYENNDAYSLMLVIGNVGSGKTTFVRYFKRIYLENKQSQLAQKCEWIFINMNSSPFNSEEIYLFMKSNIISQIKNNHKDIDFSSLEIIEKLFGQQIKEFKDGIGKLLENDEKAYKRELFEQLKQLNGDDGKLLEAMLNYLKINNSLVPIVVLDNCDKLSKDEQLLMFQVAQWLRTAFKCVVIMPMRDSTYDTYRNEPPLDTVVKDLAFRIDPPNLMKVLQARLDYLCRLEKRPATQYTLENGIKVAIGSDEQTDYFKCLLMAIRKNRFAQGIFFKLCGRNVRDGIQLFEDFCRSGHVKSEDIFMARTNQNYELPSHKFMNALLRKNRKYYTEEKSNFVNLFDAKYDDDFPDPFVRVDILRWLLERINYTSPSKTKGFLKASELLRDLQAAGHSSNVILREMNFLISKKLIISETQTEVKELNELIKITPSGDLHLSLLSNINYLAACAEDVIYKNYEIMMNISRRISGDSYLSKLSTALTANDMICYLKQYRAEYIPDPAICLANHFTAYDLKDCIDAVDSFISSDIQIKSVFESMQICKPGAKVEVTIVSKKSSHIVCVFKDGCTKGFLSAKDSKYNLSKDIYINLQEKENIICEIIDYNNQYNSFELKFFASFVGDVDN